MTALIIIAAVIFLIVLLLNFPAYAHIKYYGGKPDIKVKYLWLTLYPRSDKSGKDRKKISPEKASENKTSKAEKKETEEKTVKTDSEPPEPREESSAEKQKETSDGPAKKPDKNKPDKKKKTEKKEKEPLPDRINSLVDDLTEKKDAFLLLWELCSGHIKKLCGKIRIDDLVIDFAAADDDAADAALSYGKLNIAVYNLLAAIKRFITVTVRSVTIDCLFNTPAEKARYDGECRIKLRPASLLNAIFAIIFGYLLNLRKYSPALDVFIKKF